jgi:hypothetical protein
LRFRQFKQCTHLTAGYHAGFIHKLLDGPVPLPAALAVFR